MNKMFKFKGMPYKRSGRAGGKSVSMIGMLVLLLAALLVLPSCFDDDDDGVSLTCGAGTVLNEATDMCDPVPVDPVDPVTCGEGTMLNAATNMCDPVPVDPVTCAGGTVMSGNTCVPDPTEEYEPVREGTTAEDRHMGSDGPNMLIGGPDADYIDGGRGDDSIKGMGGDDDILGSEDDDTLYGGDGDDVLNGGAGDDTLYGGAGNDDLIGGIGNNVLDGGDGDDDIAIYKYSTRVKVDLDAGTATNVTMDTDPNAFTVGGGIDTLTGIENVKGSHGPDVIDGDENANLLKGLDGADTINGNDGDDTIIPNRPANADGSANVTDPDGNGGTTAANDGADTVNGGEGTDTISYEGEAEDVTVTLVVTPDDAQTTDVNEAATTTATVNNVSDSIATMEVPAEEEGEKSTYVSTIENIVGGAGMDTLTGDDRDNELEGRANNDELNGGGGNDILLGGGGVDELNGGDGNDMLNGGVGADADTLNGDAGNDTIHAGVGANGSSNDVIDGGEGPMMAEVDDMTTPDVDESMVDLGVDIVSFAMITEDTVEDVENNAATQGDQGVTATIGANWDAEQVHGSPLADTITGSDGRDMIVGGDGDDTLSGGGGGIGTGDDFSKATADLLVGAGGDDTLNGDSTGGSVEVFAVHVNEGGGDDTINDFTLGEDHLHFVAAEVTHVCALAAATRTVICTLSTGQTVTITYRDTPALSDPLDLDTDLNIVNDPNAG